MTEGNPKLTSAELSSTWSSCMNESMNKCILSFFLKDVEDEDIRLILEQAHNLSSARTEKLNHLFLMEELPLPTGFSEVDVNMNAPRLCTDIFMLEYIGLSTRAALITYGGFIGLSARKDIVAYFKEGLKEASNLYDKGAELSIAKGIFVRQPTIAYPTQTDTIDSKSYLSGLNPFSNKRPLNAMEIAYLHMNINNNAVGGKFAISFAQTSADSKVQKWMLRGRDITKKHIQIFTKLLINNDIQAANSADIAVTNSITPPFSDKLTMFLFSQLCALGIGNYATSAGSSLRNDIVMTYERLLVEIGQFAKDGIDLMIQNEWMEQPPGTLDRELLAKNKNVE